MADTTFEIDVDVSADSASSAAEKVALLSDRLGLAQSAAAKAAEAVKAGEASYKAAETAADRAAKSLEKINVAAELNRQKMAAAMAAGDERKFWKLAEASNQLALRQEAATEKLAAANAALAEEADSLETLQLALSMAEMQQRKLTEATDAAKASAKADAKAAADRAAAEAKAVQASAAARSKAEADAAKAKIAAEAKAAQVAKAHLDAQAKAVAAATPTGKVNELAEGFGKLGGPIGAAGQKVFGLADGLKKLASAGGGAGIYGAIAAGIALIVVGLAAAAAAAVVATAKVAAWAVGLADAARSSKLLADGVMGTVEGGTLLNAKLDELGGLVPQTREELLGMAKDLAKTGLRGKELTDALENAAIEAAKVKLGPEFAKQLLSIDSQSKRLKSNIDKVFGGLKIEKLLEGMAKLVELFDASGASGNAMKTVFESIFQPLVDGATAWIPRIRSAFIQFEILVMKGLIAIKPFYSQIILAAQALGLLAAVVGGALALVLGVVVAGVGAMAVGFGVLVAAATAVAAGVGWLIYQFTMLRDTIVGGAVAAVKQMYDYLTSVSLEQIGSDLLAGLARGITGAAGAVVGAVKGAVSGAIDSAKRLLGIASPSKVFAEIGGYTAEGMAVGVDAGAADVQGSLEAMVTPPAAPVGASAAAPPAAPASSGNAGSVFNITVNAPDGDAGSIAAALVSALEGLVSQGGKSVPA